MPANSHDTSQVSLSWMEHQMLEHIKRALRVTLEWQAPAIASERKLSSVSFAMKSFARHLERLMAIEEEDGYMKMVVDAKPNVFEKIKSLREDHHRFRQSVNQLVDELEQLESWQEAELERICREIGDLLNEVDQHDQAEIALVQDTLLFDEGGEG